MKFLVGVTRLVVVATFLASAACSKPAPLPPLRVGTSGDYAPFSKHGEGFDVVVAQMMAADLKRRVEWVPFRWPELHDAVRRGDFDVAMGGITWRPERAVDGYMSRAVAVGGPCVVGAAKPKRVGVNHGGILEAWTRSTFSTAEIVTTDENLRLPEFLASGDVDAIVTDSFEASFMRPVNAPLHCEPATDRKVYWVASEADPKLAAQIDRWLVENEPRVDALRAQHLGGSQPQTPSSHLADLLGRRLAFMPGVGAWKKANGLAIEDRTREAKVLAAVTERAKTRGLNPDRARELFAYQIELAKRVQRRTGDQAAPLDLAQVRPTLISLGDRTIDALAAMHDDGEPFDPSALSLLQNELDPAEIDELGRRIQAVLAAPRPSGAPH